MADPILVSESTLTDRYQTTVSGPVRKALHLHKRAKIRYTIQPDGSLVGDINIDLDTPLDDEADWFCRSIPISSSMDGRFSPM